jgi:hypothetical protein
MSDLTEFIQAKLEELRAFNKDKSDDEKLPIGSLMYRWLHKKFMNDKFHASDLDLVLMDTYCDGGIIAFIEHKHHPETFSRTQIRLLNQLNRDYKVFVVISYQSYSSFDVLTWPGKVSELVKYWWDIDDAERKKDLSFSGLESWERQLRVDYEDSYRKDQRDKGSKQW